MASSSNGNGHIGGRRPKVEELTVVCKAVKPSPTGGHRATLEMDLQIVGPDGVRYRGGGARLHVRVYPVPVKGTGVVKPRAPRKKKAAAGA